MRARGAVPIVLALVGLLALAGCTKGDEGPTIQPTKTSPTAEDEEVSAPVETESAAPEVYPNKPATTDLTCPQAMDAAAAVSASEVNNDEVYVTLLACGTADSWMTELVPRPGVFGMTSIAPSDAESYLMVVCYGAEETPVCQDAAALGMVM